MLAPAQIVLNSVAIGFVFELDDVLYATMVTPMMKRVYHGEPPPRASPLSVPGSVSVAATYSWVLFILNVFFSLVEYFIAAFPTDGKRRLGETFVYVRLFSNAYNRTLYVATRATTSHSMLTHVDCGVRRFMMVARGIIFCIAHLHTAIRARLYSPTPELVRSDLRIFMAKCGTSLLVTFASGFITYMFQRFCDAKLGHWRGAFDNATVPATEAGAQLAECANMYAPNQDCVQQPLVERHFNETARYCVDIGLSSWEDCWRETHANLDWWNIFND